MATATTDAVPGLKVRNRPDASVDDVFRSSEKIPRIESGAYRQLVIIAASDAKFLPAHLQMFTAPWDLGIRKAKQILYENRFIHADEALELGLVCEVVAFEQREVELSSGLL